MELIYLAIGIAIGFIIALLYANVRNSAKNNAAATEYAMLKTDNERQKQETELRMKEKDAYYQQIIEAERRNAKDLADAEKQNMQKLIDAEKASAKGLIDSANEQIEKERQHFNELRAENDRQWNEKFEAMKQEMQKQAAEQLAAKQADLQNTNRAQFDELMKPVKEQFEAFQKAVEESKKQNEVNSNHLKDSFEAQMKLFAQQQSIAVTSIKEQTDRIGNDAANLTRALKGDSKIQGDWGEMVLETMLENSGLRKDEEYFVQENVKDGDGNNYRPDVIVKFPEGRSVVIDSKVSLTAYAEAVSAEDEVQKERLIKEHVKSIKKHIDELAEKDYSKIVNGAIGYVLMFIPNESSYIAAMKQQADLSAEAYRKHIIIISPSNLMMSLQLAYNLWQEDRRNKNVEAIVKKASELYDKVVGFEDDFLEMEKAISKLSSTFVDARKKLYDGRNNIMRQTESFKELGITPKKQLRIE